MIKFKKIKETIELFDFRYFLRVRDLKSKQDFAKYSDNEIIEDIIKSKFHQWRGEEEPKGLTINMVYSEKNENKKRTLKNCRFYGFYDNSKITSSNYRSVKFKEFKKRILVPVDDFDNAKKSFTIKAQKIIKDFINPSAIFYHLDLDKKINSDIVAEWATYSVFVAFISLDKQHNIATLIEFVQD